jgi:septal ring factor EnvC (AmiA/AmiB activator)
MDNQDLINYLNNEILYYNNVIAENGNKEISLNEAITRQNNDINYFNAQILDCEASTSDYNDRIAKATAIIDILSN